MSITRGIGPARQSAPINVAGLRNLDLPWEPPAAGMPVGGKFLLVAGAFFWTREIELSLALCCKQVSWNLPSSKTDPHSGLGQDAHVGLRVRWLPEHAVRLPRPVASLHQAGPEVHWLVK